MKKFVFAGLLALGLVGCAHNNRAEDRMENAGDKVEDTAERAGDKMERAADKAGDKIEDATDN